MENMHAHLHLETINWIKTLDLEAERQQFLPLYHRGVPGVILVITVNISIKTHLH